MSRARHRITRAHLGAFRDRLFAGAVPDQAATSRQVTFGRACFAASTNIGDLIELIPNGRLFWKGCLLGSRRYNLRDDGEFFELRARTMPPPGRAVAMLSIV